VEDRFVADAHGSQSMPDGNAIDLIPIADQVARGLIPRECLCDLPRDPVRGRMRCRSKPRVGATNRSMAAMSDRLSRSLPRTTIDRPRLDPIFSTSNATIAGTLASSLSKQVFNVYGQLAYPNSGSVVNGRG
jgi:hypothetical protein